MNWHPKNIQFTLSSLPVVFVVVVGVGEFIKNQIYNVKWKSENWNVYECIIHLRFKWKNHNERMGNGRENKANRTKSAGKWSGNRAKSQLIGNTVWTVISIEWNRNSNIAPPNNAICSKKNNAPNRVCWCMRHRYIVMHAPLCRARDPWALTPDDICRFVACRCLKSSVAK